MRIFSAASAEREGAAPSTLCTRRIACACSILIALLSWDAVAQKNTSTSYVTVTLLPGEFTKTVVAPAASFFSVSYIASEEYICGLPTAAQANARLLNLAAFGQLQGALIQIESAGKASAFSIGSGFRAFYPEGKDVGRVVLRMGEQFSSSQLASGPYSHTFAANCLTVPEARTGIDDVRRIIRAHLGLPAPTD